jgi:hypothetical protein
MKRTTQGRETRSLFVLCVTAILVIASTVGVRADLNSENPEGDQRAARRRD